MWRSPFPLSPPVATAGNGFAPQANQHFPSGFQQPFPQTTSSQFTTPGPRGGPSFQPFVPPQASHKPLQSSMNNPQVLLGTSQHPPPRGYPPPLPQSSPFNSPMWQMRNPRPSVPSPGLAPQQPYILSTEPTTGAVPSLSQGPFVPSTVPTPVRSLTPLPRQLVQFPRGLDVPLQQPFSSPTMPLPVRIGPLPRRHSKPSSVAIPESTITTTPRPFTPLYGRATTPSQRPLTPCTAPPPVRTTVPLQSPYVTSTHPSPMRIAAPPHQTFTPSAVPSVAQRVPVPPQRPFPPPAVQSAVCVTTLHQRPLVPSTVSSPERAIAPPQPSFVSSIRSSPLGVTSPPQRPFAPSTIPPPGGFPTASPQQFIAPAVPSPRKVLSPPQQSVLPQKVSPPSPFNSPPNERFQPVPRQPFITPCTPPPRGVLTPPQQPFVQSTVSAIRGMTIPGQQPPPVINPSWPTQASQLSSPRLFQGPTSTIPSSLPSHSGSSFPMQQFSSPSNSPLLTASSGPSGLSHGSSIAAALDRHIMEKKLRGITKVGVPREGTNMQPSLAPKQSSSTGQTAVKRSPSLSNTQKRASFHKEDVRGREHRSRRHYSPGSRGSRPRVSRCFSPPPPDIERVVKCAVAEEYYIKKKDDQMESCHVEGTDNLSELHNRFKKEILNMESLGRADDDNESINSERSHHSDQYNSDVESLGESDITGSGNPIKSRLRLFPSDDEENSDEESSDDDSHALSDSSSESDNGEGGDLSGDNDDDDEEDHHVNKGPSVAEIRRRKIEDPRRLHPELWFNEAGETNDGPVCRCSSSDKRQGIRHGVYPGETVITPCNPMTNNADKLHHYWATVTPHTNFMTSNPSIIYSEGKNFTFEGFSMFSHHPLEQVPLCSVIRFNIEYTLHVISQPVPENFCMKDLELFSEFLFYKVLELADWNFTGNVQDSCRRYHFMPRFVHRADDTDDSKACHELLSMSQVLSHVVNSAEPLMKPSHFELSAEKWEEYNKSCKNTIVLNPDKKPAAIRVDDLQFCKTSKGLSKGKVYPHIVHHSIRPVQMSFAGDPKYQKLLRTHNKLRSLISNTPIPTRKNQDKLVKLKIELENMRLTSAMRRDVVVEVSSRGMVKTGLKSDVCQHALLLPVLVHHVRYHSSLHSLDEKMGYVFKDRALLQLALTHPSYHLNFGMNPDHARNSLSNCGVKQPRYGDRKIRRLHTRKKGITQLIRVMSNLGKMEEHQSMIRHNERLEFLGDAVLELICSIHLYFMLPSKPEGYLAMYRSSLVQNKHLAQLAKKLGLSDYMQYSHGPDLCLEEDLSHAMANCFEALLGAMYLEGGLKSATEFFTKLAFDEEELREVWTNLPKHPLQAQMPDGDRHLIASSQLLQKLQEFEEASGIEFTHIRLLARAFTHAQVGFNNLTLGSNQRMEFLGDSVLQFVVSVYLFRHFPDHHEGHLTLLRSSLVNHRIQAKLARELGLDKLINFGSKAGMKAFREKILADTLEAFVAALYVDKGLRHVELFCRVCLFPRLEEFIINQDWMDAKSQLQQCCLTSREQGKAPDLPQYKVLQNKGPAHHKYYAVAVYYKDTRLGSGEGNSIQQAEMAAAKDALASHYFPELARQKRLLDRKHQDRRRNYWNKVPRREREKDEQDKDTEIQPQWEEMETFEVQERRNAGEKENMNVDQERENWEMENGSTGQERENWEVENESTGHERENWEMEDVNLQERETWEKSDGNGCGTTENRETECSDHTLKWGLCDVRANLEEEPKGTMEESEREDGDILERWDGNGGQNVARENLGDVNVDSKVNWEEEGRNRMDSEKGENDWTENWEVENTISKENWEETDGRERKNWEEAGIERSKERCVKDGTIEHNVINSMKEKAKNEHGETKELWEVD